MSGPAQRSSDASYRPVPTEEQAEDVAVIKKALSTGNSAKDGSSVTSGTSPVLVRILLFNGRYFWCMH